MKLTLSAAALLLLAGSPALAHRLDEYLQGTIISIETSRVSAQITLTPGAAVFPGLLAEIDTDRNGVASAFEQRAYAGRVLRDISLKIDGQPLTPHLLTIRFPAIEEMRDGRGEIQIEFDADLPHGGSNRRLIFVNRHQSRIAAYQVNALVPRDPGTRILAQNRNYSQSLYELDFEQAGRSSYPRSPTWLSDSRMPLGILTVLLVPWLFLRWRHFYFYQEPSALSAAAGKFINRKSFWKRVSWRRSTRSGFELIKIKLGSRSR